MQVNYYLILFCILHFGLQDSLFGRDLVVLVIDNCTRLPINDAQIIANDSSLGTYNSDNNGIVTIDLKYNVLFLSISHSLYETGKFQLFNAFTRKSDTLVTTLFRKDKNVDLDIIVKVTSYSKNPLPNLLVNLNGIDTLKRETSQQGIAHFSASFFYDEKLYISITSEYYSVYGQRINLCNFNQKDTIRLIGEPIYNENDERYFHYTPIKFTGRTINKNSGQLVSNPIVIPFNIFKTDQNSDKLYLYSHPSGYLDEIKYSQQLFYEDFKNTGLPIVDSISNFVLNSKFRFHTIINNTNNNFFIEFLNLPNFHYLHHPPPWIDSELYKKREFIINKKYSGLIIHKNGFSPKVIYFQKPDDTEDTLVNTFSERIFLSPELNDSIKVSISLFNSSNSKFYKNVFAKLDKKGSAVFPNSKGYFNFNFEREQFPKKIYFSDGFRTIKVKLRPIGSTGELYINAEVDFDKKSIKYNLNGIPEFDFPPANPSSQYVIPRKMISLNTNLAQIDDMISSALDFGGYFERTYYAIPNGFSIITRLERMNTDGTSSKPPNRWAENYNRPSFFDPLRYAENLFFPRETSFRGFIWVVTPNGFKSANRIKYSKKEYKAWSKGGFNILPPELASKNSIGYSVSVLIYEFQTTDNSNDNIFVNDSRFSGKEHLEKSKLWDGLQLKLRLTSNK